MLIPLMLGLEESKGHGSYFFEQIFHSSLFVIGYWLTYRLFVIELRKRLPRFEDTHKRLKILVVIILIASPLLKVVFSKITEVVFCYTNLLDHPLPDSLEILVRIYIPCFLIVSIYEGVYFFMRYKQSLIDKEKMETAHVQTQLNNLRNQINPHFLFNGLNTLMNLIPLDQDKAMLYLSQLSKFYRHTVSAKEEKIIPLKKEQEFAKLYSELLLTRFGDNLKINCNLPQNTLYYILPMSLQLLIENAVKHNIISRSEPLEINIDLIETKNVVRVSNKLQKKLEAISSTGIGLNNIKRRFAFFTDAPVIITETQSEFIVELPLILSKKQ